MIANPVEEQMVVSLLILPHRWVEISFQAAETEKKSAYMWKVTYKISWNCINKWKKILLVKLPEETFGSWKYPLV